MPNNQNNKNTLDPGELTNAYNEAANRTLLAQMYAEVLAAQPLLDFVETDAGLAAETASMQKRIKNHAVYFTNKLTPAFIGTVTQATNASAILLAGLDLEEDNLANASPSEAEVKSARTVFAAVADQFDSVGDSVENSASTFELEASRLKQLRSDFDSKLNAVVASLDGPDGLIAEKLTTIAGLEDEAQAKIDGIVSGAAGVGEGAGQLVLGVLTSIATAKPDPKKAPKKEDPGAENGENKAAPGAEAKPELPAPGTSGEFVVKAIGVAKNGAAEASAAGARLRAINLQLATEYRVLAEAQNLVATAKAVSAQTSMFVRTVVEAAGSLHDIKTQWAVVASRTRGFATSLAKPASEAEAASLASSVERAEGSWKTLTAEMKSIKQSLVSSADLPDVGPFGA